VISEGLTQVSVFCADDHLGFRGVLRELVDATPGFVHVGEASSGEEAAMLVPALRPDLVLMDVHMPGMGGLRAAELLASGRRDLIVALISADPIELPRAFPTYGGRIATFVKDELCPRVLLDLWHGS
jgi:DNA-binding NarL/FixJ family response regulator